MKQMKFQFHNPGFIKVRKRVSEQSDMVLTNSNIWSWEDCGRKGEINWPRLNVTSVFTEILKGYIFHRIQTRSLATVTTHDIPYINFVSEISRKIGWPWTKEKALQIINFALEKEQNLALSFRTFYQWGFKMNISGFSKGILDELSDVKIKRPKAYASIFLNPIYLSSEDVTVILEYFNEAMDISDYTMHRDSIILQMAFELSPRAVQIHTLEEADFTIIKGQSEENNYYSINLPMAKKLGNAPIEKRARKITVEFGKRLIEFLARNSQEFPIRKNTAMFFDPQTTNRLSAQAISNLIPDHLNDLGLSEDVNLTTLRHHFAQSLADQGAAAEVIAELMGHNSTLPAREYIAATPEIGKIKTRALGKNDTYTKINSMLITGNIIEKENAPKERWVKGMVGSQYIGGIGACGLNENTACPKNPIYSCYTCPKFHPFQDGDHVEVKTGLQKQAQFFIDIAQKGMSLEHNRPVVQLERTIEAVNAVINRIN